MRQVARQTADTPTERWQETDSETNEVGPGKVAETVPSALEQTTGGVEETSLKEKREEGKKKQLGIEGRLESLAQMFAAGKDTPAEEDTEEEKS